MIMRSAKVPLSPSSALQMMYLLVGVRLRHRLPFDAGRKARAAAAAQSRSRDVGQNRIRCQCQRAFEAFVAVVGAIILHRARVDDAAPGEGEPGLAFQPRNIFGETKPEFMLAIGGHRVEQRGHILRRHRAVSHAAFHGRHLDHRLQPHQPARSVPDDLDRYVALCGSLLQRSRNFIGADGDGGSIAGNENPHFHRCASAISASMRVSSSLPTRRPSSMAEGAVAQRPRQ